MVFSLQEKTRKPYMLRSGAALDQMKTTSMATAAIWQRSGIMLYSTTSNRYHISVAPARTPADTFLSFHSRTSATARPKQRKSCKCRWRRQTSSKEKAEQHTFPSTKEPVNRLVTIAWEMRTHGYTPLRLCLMVSVAETPFL
jgi:hypothetical protein